MKAWLWGGLGCAWVAMLPLAAAIPDEPAVPVAVAAPAGGTGLAPEVGRRTALVIGNAQYKHLSALKNPVNDSRAVCDKLRGLRFDVDCLENLPDPRAMRRAVAAFVKRLQPNDTALFYYAGHGIEVGGENYLVPTEAEVSSESYVPDETFRLSFLFDELRASGVRLSILILDACRENPFAQSRSASGAGGGLALPNAPAGSIVIYPTAPGRVAYDGFGRNGLFTAHLLKHLDSPGLNIEEMFKRVIDGVRTESVPFGAPQVPWINFSFTGEFCFVGCGTRVSTAQYQALVREKEQMQQLTEQQRAAIAAMRTDFEAREQEVQTLKRRMATLQEDMRLSSMNKQMSQQALAQLEAERETLAGSARLLAQRDRELQQARAQLLQLEAAQAETSKQQQVVAGQLERIRELEEQLAQAGQAQRSAADVNRLKAERDELLAKNAAVTQELRAARVAQSELEELRKRLARFAQTQSELHAYKGRLEVAERAYLALVQEKAQIQRLAGEQQQAIQGLKQDLEAREKELATVQARMARLQEEIQAGTQEKKLSQSALSQLQQERDRLAQSAQVLAEREKELQLTRTRLQQYETRQVELARDRALSEQQQARIRELEAQLQRVGKDAPSAASMARLREERDQLQAQNAQIADKLRARQGAEQELEDLRRQVARHQTQQAELDTYRLRLETAEKQLKDAMAAAVKKAAVVAPAL
mgnify:CR=1 FL=1